MRLLLVACVLSACGYDSDLRDCSIFCAADDMGCPEGFTCGAEGLCRSVGNATACVLPTDGTGGALSHVGGRTIHTFSMSQSGSTFTPPALPHIEVLVVAGGGGGGTQRGGGGGGAGGLLHLASYDITQVPSNILIVVMVGYGGGPATNGRNSSFGMFLAIGGGAGVIGSAINGGSGGGASHNSGSSGTGTIGQGNRGGGVGFDSASMTFTGAGGGGAGGVGGVGTSNSGGAGGPGLASSISGAQIYYAGGGGGGDQDLGSHGLLPGAGGVGGGGDGGLNALGKDGVDGTGGGGGGGGGGPDPNFFSGGHGGAGVVIVSYPTTL